MEMDFIKNLKGCHITVMPELPPEGIKIDDCAMVAVPDIKQGKINLYTWLDDEWVFTSSINMSDFDLKELKDACNDLENALKKLNKFSAKIEYEGISSKLSKITTKLLQVKYELLDDVIEPLENGNLGEVNE